MGGWSVYAAVPLHASALLLPVGAYCFRSGAVLRKLEFWFKNEEDRPHWYDAWGQRAEFFLKNQIALFSRINELFSPDAALECSASGD